MSKLTKHLSLLSTDEERDGEKIDTFSELCSTICHIESNSDKDLQEIFTWFREKNIYEGNP